MAQTHVQRAGPDSEEGVRERWREPLPLREA